MDIGVIHAKADEVYAAMGERLSVGGQDLSARTRKAGRLLPRRIRRDALYMANAAELAENPKLVRMIDPARYEAAYRACMTHLKTVDPTERRKDMFLSVAGGISFAVFAVGGLTLSVLVWRGLL